MLKTGCVCMFVCTASVYCKQNVLTHSPCNQYHFHIRNTFSLPGTPQIKVDYNVKKIFHQQEQYRIKILYFKLNKNIPQNIFETF